MADTRFLEKKVNGTKDFVSFIILTAAIAAVGVLLPASGHTASSPGIPMQIVTFLLALIPIILVMVGMVGFKLSALKVAPFSFLLGVILIFSYFRNPAYDTEQLTAMVTSSTWGGIVNGLYVMGLLLFSFIILDLLKSSGSMDVIKGALSVISPDKRVQLIIIGCFVAIFLEGAAGAGTPAAIAAPFLIGLGFEPITAVVVALMADGVCVSFGGSGLTTVSGGTATVAAGVSTINLNAGMVGILHLVGVFCLPWLAVLIAFGKDSLKDRGIKPFLLFSGSICAIIVFLLSNYTGPTIVDMGAGLLCIVITMLCVKRFNIQTSSRYMNAVKAEDGTRKMPILRALSPYILIMIILPANFITARFIILGDGRDLWTHITAILTYTGWIDVLLFICSAVGAVIMRVKLPAYMAALKASIKKLIPVFIIMASLLAVANIMKIKYNDNYSMIIRAATDISSAAGLLYPAAAVLIGSIGSFITGTGLGSNIMFAEMHMSAASALNINQITVFAAQNSGGSLGNMICPNNITAACATVRETGNEGVVLKRVMKGFLVCLVLYMILSMLYTYVLFPNLSTDFSNVFSAIFK